MWTIVRRGGFPVLVLEGSQSPPGLLPGDAVETVETLPADVLALQTAQATAQAAAQAQQAADDADRGIVRADAQVRALVAMTPAQIDAWMTTNVTNLAQARTVLTRLAQIVAVLLRRELL